MMIKVSVIIPIYNSSSYMRKCLDSVIASTLKEIEIIAVDDCSQDNSVDILREYEKRYPETFRVIRMEKNGRQGAARNAGMKVAQGEYLAFVDSDDFIEANMLEKLYLAAKEKDADCCGGDYYFSKTTGEELERVDYVSFTPKENREMHRKYLQSYGMFWARIYKNSFCRQNDINFPEGIFYEDAYFNFFAALLMNKVVKVDEPFYHYTVREDSTMRQRNALHQYEKIQIPNLIFDKCETICGEGGGYNRSSFEIQYRFLNFHVATLIYTCFGQFDKPDINRIREIKASIRARMPKYKKSEAYRALSAEYKWYLNRLMFSPRYVKWCHRHNTWAYISAIKRKLSKKKS